MCQFCSFFHNITNGDIAIHDLNSHGNTEKKLNLNLKIWREGHYTPEGNIELRLTNDDRVDKVEYETAFRNRFPTFMDFLVWALKQETYKCGSLYLNSLTTLDPKVKLPKEISGYLDLRSLTTLDPKVKLPEKCGSLYLSSLTTLDPKVKLPEKCGYLYLSSLNSIEKEKLRDKYPKFTIIKYAP